MTLSGFMKFPHLMNFQWVYEIPAFDELSVPVIFEKVKGNENIMAYLPKLHAEYQYTKQYFFNVI